MLYPTLVITAVLARQGLYILLAAGTGVLPRRFRLTRYKIWMRSALLLWWLVLVLGWMTYPTGTYHGRMEDLKNRVRRSGVKKLCERESGRSRNVVSMKSLIPWLLLCSLAHGAVCPTGQAKDQAALVQIEQVWLQAAEQHDVAALGCILADEFEEAGFDGSLTDRSAMLASAAKPSNVHSELTDLHAHVYGDFGYVRGLGVNRRDDGKAPVKNRFTDIFVYRDGRWQCVAGHESHFPEERPQGH